MSNDMKNLIKRIPAIVCLVIAGTLASIGMEGWGWFLFVAVLFEGAL